MADDIKPPRRRRRPHITQPEAIARVGVWGDAITAIFAAVPMPGDKKKRAKRIQEAEAELAAAKKEDKAERIQEAETWLAHVSKTPAERRAKAEAELADLLRHVHDGSDGNQASNVVTNDVAEFLAWWFIDRKNNKLAIPSKFRFLWRDARDSVALEMAFEIEEKRAAHYATEYKWVNGVLTQTRRRGPKFPLKKTLDEELGPLAKKVGTGLRRSRKSGRRLTR